MGACCSAEASEDVETTKVKKNAKTPLSPEDSSNKASSQVDSVMLDRRGSDKGLASFRSSLRKTSIELTALATGMARGGPRIHKARGSVIKRLSETTARSSNETTLRMVPLMNCTDEQLLAEVMLRKINLHERVTKELVESKYSFGRLLGQGASGSVYEGKHHRTGQAVAIKVIKRDDDMNDDDSMTTELEILRTVRHRYLLNCHELFEAPQQIWVVMEVIRGGELLERLIDQGVYSEADAARAMKQVLMAVRYLHSQGIVHRDLKLQNLLLTERDVKTADTKVADFGLSAILPKGEYEPADTDSMKGYNKLTDRWGTPHYFAPEMIRKRYGPQVDLWALGVVLFQLLAGRLPFNATDTKTIFEQVLNAPQRLEDLMSRVEWRGISESARDLVLKLLERDPMRRLNADEALNHPWVTFKGSAATGNLTVAHSLLKQEAAKRHIADMMHVLDIMNALESSGAARTHSSMAGGKKFRPGLVKHVSTDFFDAEKTDLRASGHGGRRRQASKTDMVEELYSVFNLFDRDNNGSIECDELAMLMKKLGVSPDEDKIREIVRLVDANSNGKLEFDEFCEFMKAAKKSIVTERAIERELDSLQNDMGYLNGDDIRGMMSAISEHLGKPLFTSEVESIIQLSEEANPSHHAQPAALAKVMLMPAGERNRALSTIRTGDERETEMLRASLSASAPVQLGDHISSSI
mmetsp:Transcript_68558/g.113932  ORF Transcript_68558/g.113932 Transcript_68558/m.113932 type:complete len:697 (+) Transcript_68558:79-2169(+)|eukprot:CAMPEP_0119345588 /NCGR_PEP_ID=MMETSP1333-20130426/107566_1 /TAXON_ID=418940 /ORGANISM="Scyphosphaera apsteinii, Strain RCC1455" /LENGTH=696 /DNA_ID=CAMNT_0007358065 /DNA_START=72 /DNA_END=2162 /DNA_ORIENTATION=+